MGKAVATPTSDRGRYDPRVVRFMIGLTRFMVRRGIADLVYWVVGLPLALGMQVLFIRPNQVRWIGLEKVPLEKGFFLLCNHVSMAEAPIIGATWWPRAIWYPSKAEFYNSWIFGFIYLFATAMHTFPVRRGERDDDAIGLMRQLLQRGDRVLLFPEGTRSRDGNLLPGKPGVGMLIHSARPTVVPCYVEGFDRIIPPGGLFVPRFGQKATYRFGPPLDLSRFWDRPFGREVGQEIVDEVMAEIALLKADSDAERAGEGTA